MRLLTDHNNVRVVCFYKYGKDLPQAPFSGKYANPGDIVWFELTSETDLDKIKDEGYEQSGFHKYTGWGNWLRMNEQSLGHNPQCGGGGA